MRILMLNYEYPPLGGGGGVAAKQIAEGFVDLGHHVDYVTSGYETLSRTEVINGVHVYREPVVGRDSESTASLPSLLTYPVSGFTRCLHLCRQYEYDVINTHFAIPSGPLGVTIANLFDVDHLLSVHGGDIYDPTKSLSPHRHLPLRKVIEFVTDQVDEDVAQSTDTKGNMLEYYDVDTDVNVVPLPYEPFSFESVSRKELGLDEKKVYTVSIGRLIERKGYDYLIEAIAAVDHENLEAIIIGSGPKEAELRQLAQRRGVADQIHLVGYVDESTKFQYLAAADMYVLSSRHEGFGICLQEAMQVGLPIVATNHGGHTDLIKDGRNGLLVPTGDTKALSNAIDKLANEETAKIERTNREQVKIYEPANICRSLLELIET